MFKICVVCNIKRANVRLLPCKHVIHARCRYPWPLDFCPACNFQITSVEVCDIEPFQYNRETYSPPQNLSSTSVQRSGRWSQEETTYARYLMESFMIGEVEALH